MRTHRPPTGSYEDASEAREQPRTPFPQKQRCSSEPRGRRSMALALELVYPSDEFIREETRCESAATRPQSDSVRSPVDLLCHDSGFRRIPHSTRPLPLPAPRFLFFVSLLFVRHPTRPPSHTHTHTPTHTHCSTASSCPSFSFHSREMIYLVSPSPPPVLRRPRGQQRRAPSLSGF